MEILQSFKVDKLFDTIMIESAYSANYSTIHHLGCGHTFGGQWERKYHPYHGYITGAKYYTCPNCGEYSNPYNHKILMYYNEDKIMPVNLMVDIIECKNHIDLRVRHEGIKLDYTGKLYEQGRIEERLRFDFKRKIAVFIDSDKNHHEVTINYLRDNRADIFEILDYLGDSYAVHGDFRKRLIDIFKTLRSAFERRMQQAYGFKCKDVYIAPSNNEDEGFHKTMLLNMCLKIAAPDIPNLKVLIKTNPSGYPLGIFFSETVLDDTRKGMNFHEALRKHFNAPNSRALRQKMLEIPSAVLISDTLHMFKDENNRRKILNLKRSFDLRNHRPTTLFSIDQIISNTNNKSRTRSVISTLISRYGETAVLNHIIKSDVPETKDALRMYGNLKGKYRKEVWKKQFRLREFHDVVTAIYNKQEYGDIVLPELPALGSDVNGMHFMVPQTAADLMTVGKALKNCVGSYRDKVVKGECAIVVVTDDHMKPVACLELKKDVATNAFNRLVQARIFANKAVSQNKEVNTAVLAWADQLKIEPVTIDVEAQVS